MIDSANLPDPSFFHVHDTKRVDQLHPGPGTVMVDPTKVETEQVFKILKSQKGNKVRRKMHGTDDDQRTLTAYRLALTAKLVTRHGPALHSESIFAWNVRVYTGTWACISVL